MNDRTHGTQFGSSDDKDRSFVTDRLENIRWIINTCLTGIAIGIGVGFMLWLVLS